MTIRTNKELELIIEAAIHSSTDEHRCLDGTMCSTSSPECITDLELRINDALLDRDACSPGTAIRSNYNGLLSALRKKLRRSLKLQPVVEPQDIEEPVVEECESALHEALTKTDIKSIERISKAQAKDQIDKSIEKALKANYFGSKDDVVKFVEKEVGKIVKNGADDKDFSLSVEKISKRVIQALFSLHFKRDNLIKNMPVPKK